MSKKLFVGLVTSVFLIGIVSFVNATPVTFTFTADNEIEVIQVRDNGLIDKTTAPGTNSANWRIADTWVSNLAAGDYWAVFEIENFGNFSNGNPAAFLGQIDTGSEVIVSSASWQIKFNDGSSWGNFGSTTEYGSNGGTNIWTNVNGGNPIAGIASNAQWIWGANNFSNGDFADAKVRTRFTVAPVPEPTTMLLFGTGIAGLVGMRRKRIK